MSGSRLWGSLFFLFMTFAAFSTVIAVFQNIIACARDLWGWSLRKSVLINGALLLILGVPCIWGMTDWSSFNILGKSIMDIEDFLVSNNLLPLGAVVFLFFCTTRYGWGWRNFLEEANEGKGLRFPKAKWYRFYLTFILPVAILVITAIAYISLFKK
jgi:NSS family neurotransmitter:Na+ symporter